MTTARETLDRIGYDFTGGDEWGAAMGALFDIAHALEHYGHDYVPAHWQYRDGIGCNGLWRDSDEDRNSRSIAARIVRRPETECDIVHAGNVLERYTRLLEHAGRSY